MLAVNTFAFANCACVAKNSYSVITIEQMSKSGARKYLYDPRQGKEAIRLESGETAVEPPKLAA